MIKVILLDIDNTLLSFDGFVIETMKSGFKKFNLGTYKDDMFNVFNQINTSLWQQLETGIITLEDLKKIRWNMIFKQLGIDFDGIIFERYFRECLLNSAIIIDGAIELLDYLKEKYILCAASNGPYHQQINRLKISGLLPYFYDFFISEEIGSSKPSEEFFNICIERLNKKTKQKILSNEIMIIGDSLSSDMAGGINSGLQTCFYNPKKKTIKNDINPTYQVSSLLGIKNIL